MKLLLILPAVLLAGCSAMADRSYGSWLDRMGTEPAVPMTAEAAEQSARLRAQAEVIRAQLAVEKDRVRRIAYYRQLRDIGEELRAVERVIRPVPLPPDPAQDSAA
jgi:hypothetical protein